MSDVNCDQCALREIEMYQRVEEEMEVREVGRLQGSRGLHEGICCQSNDEQELRCC